MDPVTPAVPATLDLTAWLLSLVPPDVLTFVLAHPFVVIIGLYVLSALLSTVPTTYVFEVPKIGMKIPVGYLVHLLIGNVFQVVRKVSPIFADSVDKLLPGKRVEPETLKPPTGGAP